jgi:hypothetical protein
MEDSLWIHEMEDSLWIHDGIHRQARHMVNVIGPGIGSIYTWDPKRISATSKPFHIQVRVGKIWNPTKTRHMWYNLFYFSACFTFLAFCCLLHLPPRENVHDKKHIQEHISKQVTVASEFRRESCTYHSIDFSHNISINSVQIDW